MLTKKQTRLKNKFLKNRAKATRVCYNKQRNFFGNLLRKTEKYYYYGNLNEKNVIDNRRLWKSTDW